MSTAPKVILVNGNKLRELILNQATYKRNCFDALKTSGWTETAVADTAVEVDFKDGNNRNFGGLTKKVNGVSFYLKASREALDPNTSGTGWYDGQPPYMPTQYEMNRTFQSAIITDRGAITAISVTSDIALLGFEASSDLSDSIQITLEKRVT